MHTPFRQERCYHTPVPRPADVMELPDSQLESIRTRASTLLDACATAAGAPDEDDLRRLHHAFAQLTDVMARLDADAASGQADAVDITEIGEYALRLAENLAATLERLQPQTHRLEVAGLVIACALWVTRLGGRIDTLEPVVDALALLANTIHEPRQLGTLSERIRQIVAAVSPLIREDLEKANPGRPWRVLLLNQSIIATRSHDTDLMEHAFSELTRYLPEDAPRFFAEGMQQMEALNYPEHVREVMQKYYRQWTVNRALH